MPPLMNLRSVVARVGRSIGSRRSFSASPNGASEAAAASLVVPCFVLGFCVYVGVETNPMKSLRSVVAEVGRSMGRGRNFSSSPGSSNEKSDVSELALMVIPFCVGYGLAGPIIFGEKVSLLEEKRKEEWRKLYGESVEIAGDVRDMPGLGAIFYSHLKGNAARWWSAKKS